MLGSLQKDDDDEISNLVDLHMVKTTKPLGNIRGEEVVVRWLSRGGRKASTARGGGDGGVGCSDDEVGDRDGGDVVMVGG
ncbi:hypothetical protein Tco_0457557 [Tanacetum coccineum]